MRGGGCVSDQAAAIDSAGPDGGSKLGGSGDEDADEVGDGSAGDQHARGLRREPQHFGCPGDDLALHLDRCVVAAAEICVQAAGQ